MDNPMNYSEQKERMSLWQKQEFLADWLKTLFGSNPIPTYDVSEDTLDGLLNLAEENTMLEKDKKAEMDLLVELTKAMRAEREKMVEMLTKLGMANSFSDGPISNLLNILVELSVLLECDGDNLFLRILDLKRKSAKAPLEKHQTECLKSANEAKKIDTLGLYQSAKELLSKSQENSMSVQKKTKERERKAEFLSQKSKEYVAQTGKFENTLKQRGFKEDLSHESIESLKTELDSLKDALEPLEKKKNAYKSLPPDFELAKLKLAEAKEELRQLTSQLTQEISGLHI